jgi:hypothetical protein
LQARVLSFLQRNMHFDMFFDRRYDSGATKLASYEGMGFFLCRRCVQQTLSAETTHFLAIAFADN